MPSFKVFPITYRGPFLSLHSNERLNRIDYDEYSVSLPSGLIFQPTMDLTLLSELDVDFQHID